MIEEKKILNNFKKEGYLVIEGVLSTNECIRLKNIAKSLYPRFKNRYATSKKISDHNLDKKNQEELIFNLHNKDYAFVELLDHPVSLSLVSQILQEGSYQNKEPFIYLNSAARNILPGFPAQHLHIDSRFPASKYALNVQVFWLLDNFTKENGSTRLIPGSQNYDTYPDNNKKYDNEILITAKQGSLLIFNGSCWHGSSAKKNNKDRWALIYTFGRWFLKPSFDFNKNIPKKFYSKMNDKQKELLGYKFNPSKDEFTRISTRAEEFEDPENDYNLPY